MKRISTRLIFAATLLLSSAAWGQEQYPPLLQKERLDDDPTFQQLSQENQTWVKRLTDRIYLAANDWELKALQRQYLDFTRSQFIGRQFCNHTFTQATYLDAVRTNSGTRAFAVRWLDPEPGTTIVHTALSTDSRCVVRDGDLIDGKRIFRVLPNSLAISHQDGLVAYEALYSDPADDITPGHSYRRGVFIDKRFVADIEPQSLTASPDEDAFDFWWREDLERLEISPGLRVRPIPNNAGRPKQ